MLTNRADKHYAWRESDAADHATIEEINARKSSLEEIIEPTKVRREFYDESPVIF